MAWEAFPPLRLSNMRKDSAMLCIYQALSQCLLNEQTHACRTRRQSCYFQLSLSGGRFHLQLLRYSSSALLPSHCCSVLSSLTRRKDESQSGNHILSQDRADGNQRSQTEEPSEPTSLFCRRRYLPLLSCPILGWWEGPRWLKGVHRMLTFEGPGWVSNVL